MGRTAQGPVELRAGAARRCRGPGSERYRDRLGHSLPKPYNALRLDPVYRSGAPAVEKRAPRCRYALLERAGDMAPELLISVGQIGGSVEAGSPVTRTLEA